MTPCISHLSSLTVLWSTAICSVIASGFRETQGKRGGQGGNKPWKRGIWVSGGPGFQQPQEERVITPVINDLLDTLLLTVLFVAQASNHHLQSSFYT